MMPRLLFAIVLGLGMFGFVVMAAAMAKIGL
jgi:hypothetical protein